MAEVTIDLIEFDRMRDRNKELNQLKRDIRNAVQIVIDREEYQKAVEEEFDGDGQEEAIEAEIKVDINKIKEIILEGAGQLYDKEGEALYDDFKADLDIEYKLDLIDPAE